MLNTRSRQRQSFRNNGYYFRIKDRNILHKSYKSNNTIPSCQFHNDVVECHVAQFNRKTEKLFGLWINIKDGSSKIGWLPFELVEQIKNVKHGTTLRPEYGTQRWDLQKIQFVWNKEYEYWEKEKGYWQNLVN